ncbi:hypothetical protein FQN53_001247 [Emmonsiellopsis sp. PD_33]|nr:hypothetical protein FQN53_001247 [Emmonsiellopsis sp. PD_33]
MACSDEVEWWFNAVYDAVQQIPRGKVTLYGHIARLLGQHGVSTSIDSDGTDHYYHSDNVPWQRVVNAKGMISHRGPGSAARQALVLEEEGVAVQADSMGEYSIDLGRYGWYPERLAGDESDESDGGSVKDEGGNGEVQLES